MLEIINVFHVQAPNSIPQEIVLLLLIAPLIHLLILMDKFVLLVILIA